MHDTLYTIHNYIIIIIAEHDINLGITNFYQPHINLGITNFYQPHINTFQDC